MATRIPEARRRAGTEAFRDSDILRQEFRPPAHRLAGDHKLAVAAVVEGPGQPGRAGPRGFHQFPHEQIVFRRAAASKLALELAYIELS